MSTQDPTIPNLTNTPNEPKTAKGIAFYKDELNQMLAYELFVPDYAGDKFSVDSPERANEYLNPVFSYLPPAEPFCIYKAPNYPGYYYLSIKTFPSNEIVHTLFRISKHGYVFCQVEEDGGIEDLHSPPFGSVKEMITSFTLKKAHKQIQSQVPSQTQSQDNKETKAKEQVIKSPLFRNVACDPDNPDNQTLSLDLPKLFIRPGLKSNEFIVTRCYAFNKDGERLYWHDHFEVVPGGFKPIPGQDWQIRPNLNDLLKEFYFVTDANFEIIEREKIIDKQIKNNNDINVVSFMTWRNIITKKNTSYAIVLGGNDSAPFRLYYKKPGDKSDKPALEEIFFIIYKGMFIVLNNKTDKIATEAYPTIESMLKEKGLISKAQESKEISNTEVTTSPEVTKSTETTTSNEISAINEVIAYNKNLALQKKRNERKETPIYTSEHPSLSFLNPVTKRIYYNKDKLDIILKCISNPNFIALLRENKIHKLRKGTTLNVTIDGKPRSLTLTRSLRFDEDYQNCYIHHEGSIGEGSYGKVKIVQNIKTGAILADKIRSYKSETDSDRITASNARHILKYMEQYRGGGLVSRKTDDVKKKIEGKFDNIDNVSITIPGSAKSTAKIIAKDHTHQKLLKRSMIHYFHLNTPYLEKLDFFISLLKDYDERFYQKGIVHRDLSSGNVMDDDNGAHIIDVDLAITPKTAREAGYQVIRESESIRVFVPPTNRPNLLKVVTTKMYAAPEVLSDGKYSDRGDIFSLGKIGEDMFFYGGNPKMTASHQLDDKLFQEQTTKMREILNLMTHEDFHKRPDIQSLRKMLLELRSELAPKSSFKPSS